MRMPAKDKKCLFGGKLWAQNSFGANRTVWYARNWTANPDRQPTYAGITFMRGFTSNGGTRNRDDSSRPVRLSLQRGQKSPGFDCRVPWKDYPSYVDVDGFYVPAGWWVRIETLHLRGTNTWRYWRNLPGGKTGRWYKVNGPSSALGGKYKLAWAWIGGNQPS